MRKYVFLGDSLIYGYGVSLKDNWVYKLKNTLNLNLYNKGINGSTTTDMLIRFEEDVLSLNPTDVFIMGGTNDLLSNRSVQSIINNIELMIKDLLKENINIIIGFYADIYLKYAFIACFFIISIGIGGIYIYFRKSINCGKNIQ